MANNKDLIMKDGKVEGPTKTDNKCRYYDVVCGFASRGGKCRAEHDWQCKPAKHKK